MISDTPFPHRKITIKLSSLETAWTKAKGSWKVLNQTATQNMNAIIKLTSHYLKVFGKNLW